MNKFVENARLRSRASLEKSARAAGVKNVGHKNKLQLAQDIDRARKDRRNAKAREITAGRKLAKMPEKKRTGKIYRPRNRSATFWNAYKEAMHA